MYLNTKLKHFFYALQVFILLAVPLLHVTPARAAFLTNRSITVGSPITSATTEYRANFTLTTATTLGSINLEFCDNSPLPDQPCNIPPGLSINTATLSNQSGETGFAIDPSSTANSILLSRPASASFNIPVSYTFTNVTNPSTPNYTVYMRIYTFPTINGTGVETDKGAAAFSTSGTFGTSAFVPPHLDFCVGVTVDSRCASTSGDSVSFGDLAANKVSSVTTQCAAATNDPTGYVIYSLGSTMTSGNNVIPAINSPNPSIAGIAQFGINMRANNNPTKGENISGDGTGFVMPNYNTPNLYAFSPGAAVAQATQATDFNVYTTTYVANITNSQPVGVYATTISYVAVAQF